MKLFRALPSEFSPMIAKFSIEGKRFLSSNPSVLQARLGTLAKTNLKGDSLLTQSLNQRLLNAVSDTPEARALRATYNFGSLGGSG